MMNAGSSQLAAYVLLGGALLGALAGLPLLVRGWWPRRQGDAPHCRACDYLLTANESGRCPECGADVSQPRSVVHGVARRSRGKVLAGLSLFAVGLLGVIAGSSDAVRNVDWYRYCPVGWVVDDAMSPVAAKADRGWTELVRRRAAGALSDAATQRMIEAALSAQAKPTGAQASRHQRIVDFLAGNYLEGRLTPEQADRFFTAALNASLAVRPLVAEGDLIPYQRTGGSGPQTKFGQWWVTLTQAGIWIDGSQVEPGSGSSGSSQLGSSTWSSTVSAPKGLSAGPHTMELREQAEVFIVPPGGGGPKGPPVWSKPLAYQAKLTVVPKGQAPPLAMLEKPELAAVIGQRIKVTQFEYRPPWQAGQEGRWSATVSFGTMPEAIAFDVFARTGDGRDIPLQTVSVRKGASTNYVLSSESMPHTSIRDQAVDFIFRSNPAIALRTVDMSEMWSGEIVVKGVKVTLPPQPAAK